MRQPLCYHGHPYPRTADWSEPDHDCRQYADYAGGSYSVEPHGETFWDEQWICTKCGAKLTERDMESASA
jgi:hypothetical protein